MLQDNTSERDKEKGSVYDRNHLEQYILNLTLRLSKQTSEVDPAILNVSERLWKIIEHVETLLHENVEQLKEKDYKEWISCLKVSRFD